MKTCHSEYGKIREVYIKTPINSFISQEAVKEQWKELNYLGLPDYEESIREYAVFKKFFSKEGMILKEFSKNTALSIDSIYCRDASIATDYGLILCNMGKGGRVLEPDAARSDYEGNGELILGRIEGEGRLEGGDVAWINETTLAVGRTYRTNDEGIRQLKALVEKFGIDIIVVDLPHYKGPSDVFHLMSIFSPVDKDLAVVYSPLMPVRFRAYLLSEGFKFVEVADEEFESMGCNVLALGPRDCIMLSGNPITESRLEKAGCNIQTYKGREISLKGGGGPTCLSRPLLREI